MSGTESAYSNSRVLGFDPYIDNGIAEEAMITVIFTIRENCPRRVARLGAIVSEYGTTESNGILFFRR